MRKIYPISPDLKGRVYIHPRAEGFCLWCGMDLKLVNDRRRTSYCCSEHSIKYNSHFDWQFGVKSFIFQRDNYTCVECGISLEEWQSKPYIERHKISKELIIKPYQSFLEVDHIKPVKMGGNPFDHSNLQTLCQKCHKAKTKIDIGNIANINAICREVREYWKRTDRIIYLLGFFNGN